MEAASRFELENKGFADLSTVLISPMKIKNQPSEAATDSATVLGRIITSASVSLFPSSTIRTKVGRFSLNVPSVKVIVIVCIGGVFIGFAPPFVLKVPVFPGCQNRSKIHPQGRRHTLRGRHI
jgi:hypothetical protein